MNKKYDLGIIGGGNMATAILNGIITSGKLMKPERIIISDIDKSKLSDHAKLGINTTDNNNEVFDNSEFILFAIKPQIFHIIKESLKGIRKDQHIISIMAGISIDTIKSVLTDSVPICRVMPNTPCMVNAGMSVLCYDKYNSKSKLFVDSIFQSIGEIAHMSEEKFDAVTSISGSGPAYVYLFIDSLVKGGIDGGLSEEDSRKLAVTTFIGASKMVQINDKKPINDLIDAVCSKGGTTIEAINVYRDNKLPELIIKGVKACRNRSKELSGK